MTSKSFFLLTFIVSASISILSFFFTKETQLLLLDMGVVYKIDFIFIGFVGLITSIFSYVTMDISCYIEKKREKIRLKKLEKERINLDKIHKELMAITQ